jgi:hypothetical protein
MKLYNILWLTFFALAACSDGHFSKEIKRATGDLNKDGHDDLVVVTQDTKDSKRPYRLQVFFKNADGKNDLVVSTDKAIAPAFPDGNTGGPGDEPFGDITINNGVLTIEIQLLRGHYEHKFRYQNGNFELIGFSDGESDGHGTISTVDFNLSTGLRLEKEERYDTDLVMRNEKKTVMVRPLPKLQDFQPLQNKMY